LFEKGLGEELGVATRLNYLRFGFICAW